MIKLVIADDEHMIRQGLSMIDWAGAGIKLEGIGTNGIDTLEIVRKVNPHILLTDIRMPGIDGIELSRTIRDEMPWVKIVLLTGYQEFHTVHSAIQLGAVGFVLKPADPEEILSAVLKAKKLIDEEQEKEKSEKELRRQVKEAQMAIQNKVVGDVPSGMHSETIERVIRYIEMNYMKNITLGTTGDHVHLNPVYLSRLLKKETGENFLDILTRIRISKSLDLLKDPCVKTYEAAARVGVHDAKYFGQVFKKYFGLTPAEFRKSLLKPGVSDGD